MCRRPSQEAFFYYKLVKGKSSKFMVGLERKLMVLIVLFPPLVNCLALAIAGDSYGPQGLYC